MEQIDQPPAQLSIAEQEDLILSQLTERQRAAVARGLGSVTLERPANSAPLPPRGVLLDMMLAQNLRRNASPDLPAA